MGKSAKAKKDAKLSFQKPKLKVGKAKPKSANFTDTSFKSTSINLNQQSLYTAAPSQAAQFSHHLALLNHKSENQRRESLAHLTSALSSSKGRALPLPASAVLPKVQPLLLDSSGAVRSQCIKFLEALPVAIVKDNMDMLLLYTRAAMTHLSPRIRDTGMDALNSLLQVAPETLVTSAGGWTKTLPALLGLMGWGGHQPASKAASKGWISAGGITSGGVKNEVDSKRAIRQMDVLKQLLTAGLRDADADQKNHFKLLELRQAWPLWQFEHHVIAKGSNPYAHLNLYGELGAEATEMCPDLSDRHRVLATYVGGIKSGIERAKSQGGGIGRAAMSMEKIIGHPSGMH